MGPCRAGALGKGVDTPEFRNQARRGLMGNQQVDLGFLLRIHISWTAAEAFVQLGRPGKRVRLWIETDRG